MTPDQSSTAGTWSEFAGFQLEAMESTGSRIAWLAGLVSLPWLLWFACRPRERPWVYGALVAAGGLVLALVGLEGLGRLRIVGIENSLSRPEIWRVAWQALTEHPWTGVGPGPESFNAYLSSAYGGAAPELVPNAHNLWLIFASEYGVFGLAAVLWLTLGLLWLGWRWGRWRGIAFVLPLFSLNFYDYNLFSWWILFLVILGLNQLVRDPQDAFLPVPQPKQEAKPQTAKHHVGQPRPEPDLDQPLDR
jgi:O-antigen ligase